MRPAKITFTFLFLSLLFPLMIYCQFQQAALSPGYRIQYASKDKWQRYSTHFAHFYYTQGADSLCKYTIENFEPILKQLEQESGLKSRGILNVVIYPSQYQFFETNIGSNDSRKYTYPTITFDAGGRIVLAFEGSYEQYTLDLKKALMQHLWEKNITQSGLANNNIYIKPEMQWFQEGCINFISNGFSLNENDRLFELVQGSQKINMDSLMKTANPKERQLLAKGFCWFLTQHYRKDALKQISFQLKQRKSLQTALRMVTKRNWDELLIVYTAFLQHIYGLPNVEQSMLNAASIDLKDSAKNPNEPLKILYANADSSWMIYSKLKPYSKSIYLKQANKTQKLAFTQTPLWLTKIDITYPHVEFHNNKILILDIKKGKHQVAIFNISGHKIRTVALPMGIDGINSFKVVNDNLWLLSAYTKGRSDIVSFNPQTLKLKPLTNDLADNVNLKIDNSGNMIYRSGFPISLNKDSSLTKVLSSSKPYGTYGNNIQALDERIIAIDSVVFESKIQNYYSQATTIPVAQQYWMAAFIKQKQIADSLQQIENIRKKEAESNPTFLSGLLQHSAKTKEEKTENEAVFDKKRIRPYLLQLSNLWFNASVNNDYFINRLQPYQGQLGIYKFPEIGGMLMGGYADVFENYEFNVGYKMPAGTEGSDFFFRYKNKKQRTDWWLLYHRKVESLQPNAANPWMDEQGRPYPSTAKIKSYYFEAGFAYPLNFNAAIQLTAALRNNKTVFLTTDKYSLTYPALKDLWNINTINYTYNNIKSCEGNQLMLDGIRLKTNVDVVLGISKQRPFSYGLTQNVEWYKPINKWLNWYNNLSLGYSGGPQYISYNFGGMDNNVITRVDSNAVFDQNAPYLFQQLVSPLRGFKQNTMWGNAFGILNTELFAQVFNGGIIPIQTKFQFINLMQFGVFADWAYSKATWNPNAEWQNRNSFGLSLKTILANYPIRVDIAFPYNLNYKPMVHLSLRL